MPHSPTVVVWTSTDGMAFAIADPSEFLHDIQAIRGVQRFGPGRVKHFFIDVEELDKSTSKRKDQYDVSGKVTVESQKPTEFDYRNIAGVLMMDTADHMSDDLKLEMIKFLNRFISKITQLPSTQPGSAGATLQGTRTTADSMAPETGE